MRSSSSFSFDKAPIRDQSPLYLHTHKFPTPFLDILGAIPLQPNFNRRKVNREFMQNCHSITKACCILNTTKMLKECVRLNCTQDHFLSLQGSNSKCLMQVCKKKRNPSVAPLQLWAQIITSSLQTDQSNKHINQRMQRHWDIHTKGKHTPRLWNQVWRQRWPFAAKAPCSEKRSCWNHHPLYSHLRFSFQLLGWRFCSVFFFQLYCDDD